MNPDDQGLAEDVKKYLKQYERGDLLAWYTYMTIRTNYRSREEGDSGTLYVESPNEYSHPDEVYDAYGFFTASSAEGGEKVSHRRALPSTYRAEIPRPSLNSFADAFNGFVDNPEMEEKVEDYVREMWEPYYREEIEPVWNFLEDVPINTGNEEELLDMAEGYGEGVESRLELVLQKFSGSFTDASDLQALFEEELEENFFWLDIVHQMEHGEEESMIDRWNSRLRGVEPDGFSVSGEIRDSIIQEIDELYHWVGGGERSVYVDGDEVYELKSGEESRLEQVPDRASVAPLHELVEVYENLRDSAGNPGEASRIFDIARELYLLGDARDRNAEVFYDSRRDSVYVYDHDEIEFRPAEDVMRWLDTVSLDSSILDSGVGGQPLFESVMSEEDRQAVSNFSRSPADEV